MLFRSLFIADESGGIELRVNVTNLYQIYPAGTKVIINCKGMYLGSYGGVTQLGGLFNGTFGRIELTELNNKVFAVSRETVVPVETTITGINDSMLGKMIILNAVEFIDSDLGKTYAESAATTNRTIKNASNNTIIVRTSNYANFASATLPSNSGSIKAILSKFNGTYQLYIRVQSDVVFDQPRF